MPIKESLFEDIYAVVRLIPQGRVSSYGAIARYLGTTGSARVVGWAMNSSHSVSDMIPAHRVVNRNGLLTGKHHFSDSNAMEEMLNNEGIVVENNKIVNFENLFWDPCLELNL